MRAGIANYAGAGKKPIKSSLLAVFLPLAIQFRSGFKQAAPFDCKLVRIVSGELRARFAAIFRKMAFKYSWTVHSNW